MGPILTRIPLQGLVLISVALAPAGALAQPDLTDGALESLDSLVHMFNVGGLVASLIIVFIAMVVLRFITGIVDNIGEVFAERRLTLQKFNAIFQFAVYLMMGVMIVRLSFNFSEQTLSLIGGAVAFAVGFAAKDLVASLVAGFLIMIDRPFQVGDRVTFGGEYGDVTAIGLRSVRIRTLDDSVVTVPNNQFLTDITVCGNYGVLDMQIMVDLYIGTDQDIVRARDLLEEATATSKFVYLEKSIEVLASQVVLENLVAVRMRVKAYVVDTRYEKEFETDITIRAMAAFADNGILPPSRLPKAS